MKFQHFLLFGLVWLQSCTSSPSTPGASAQTAEPSAISGEGVVLGDSPDHAFRLFKMQRSVNGQPESYLKVVRLSDLKEAEVSRMGAEPKFYWSSQNAHLIAEHAPADSAGRSNTIIFDLYNFKVAQKKYMPLVAFDYVNDIIFNYRYTDDRQTLCFYTPSRPDEERSRDLIMPPAGKNPVVTLNIKERKARVKAYTTGGVPSNFEIKY